MIDFIGIQLNTIINKDQFTGLKIYLFGSTTYSLDNSDIDLLVEFLPESHPGLFEMGALKEDLEERLGCQVDLLTRKAVEGSRNLIRRNAILGNRVTLYVR